MWHINEAIKLIEELNPKVREFGYHICLGGSVLYAGESDNDLDLYFLPLEPDFPLKKEKNSLIFGIQPSVLDLEQFLISKWGTPEINAQYGDSELYSRKFIFIIGDDSFPIKDRIDVFII